ncbi:hypothetical protein [Nannocystis bainbridge]|uniref:Uncharacterized protein n=1 Tax=Nannocystis bainbridge TaxID=2995303 RepID=A0ABT5DTI5_9BACT|nr:hypothetical protein [Nannocystis bainbridge]MDC0716954.1 hypothetical protein [Nannocystis bainbridge]
MTDAAISDAEAIAILGDAFVEPIVVAIAEPDAWWGQPEVTLRFRVEPVEDAGWADFKRELDTHGLGRTRTGQWIELVPRGTTVSRARYQAFALGLRDAMPAIFVRLGPHDEDPAHAFLVATLRDASLVTREEFARAMRG